MQSVTVSRVFIWSRWLRLTHWALAISIFGMLMSGWLMAVDPLLFSTAKDYHYIFSALMLPALILRLYLLFLGNGTDHLHDCELDTHKLIQAWEVIRFYLTLGRAPLPKWYSHNPLWGPIYLILFFFLVLSTVSGFTLAKEIATLANISMHDLHMLSYVVIGTFVFLHLPAVFSHDLSGKCSDVSAMINGYRTFKVANPSLQKTSQGQRVAFDGLLKSSK